VADEVSVLVVDDSALMRNLITRMVEATPGLVVADRAMNGIFALQKIPRCNPDVIVLDLEMPEMSGVEFLRERKRLGIEIPVIILSSIARRGAETTMGSPGVGGQRFVKKPRARLRRTSGRSRINLRSCCWPTEAGIGSKRVVRLRSFQTSPNAVSREPSGASPF